MIELSRVLNIRLLEVVFEWMKKNFQEKINDSFVNLIAEFSLNAQKCVSNKGFWGSSLSNPQNEFFGINILWNLIQDSSNLNSYQTDNAINGFLKLLGAAEFKIKREFYWQQCIENLINNQSQIQSILIAIGII